MAQQKGISYEDIVRDVRAGKVAPIYYLMGDEPYYIDKVSDFIVDAVLKPDDDPGQVINSLRHGNVPPLTLLGIVAISDPVRPDVPAAIQDCRNAGVKVKIVTGDTGATAREIGRQVGLWNDDDDRDNNNNDNDHDNVVPDNNENNKGHGGKTDPDTGDDTNTGMLLIALLAMLASLIGISSFIRSRI